MASSAPFWFAAIRPLRASASSSPVQQWPMNSHAITRSCAISVRGTRSPLAEMMVLLVKVIDKASDSPRMMKKKASVTMNDGSPVRTGTLPLTQPSASATATGSGKQASLLG